MRHGAVSIFTDREIDDINDVLNRALSDIKECEEDKDLIKCVTCPVAHTRWSIKQAMAMINGKEYLGGGLIDGER